MKTTRYDAEKIYNLGNHIDPFQSCSMDKPEIINAIMDLSLEENIEQLKEVILESYESIDVLNDTELMRQYLNITRRLRK